MVLQKSGVQLREQRSGVPLAGPQFLLSRTLLQVPVLAMLEMCSVRSVLEGQQVLAGADLGDARGNGHWKPKVDGGLDIDFAQR